MYRSVLTAATNQHFQISTAAHDLFSQISTTSTTAPQISNYSINCGKKKLLTTKCWVIGSRNVSFFFLWYFIKNSTGPVSWSCSRNWNQKFIDILEITYLLLRVINLLQLTNFSRSFANELESHVWPCNTNALLATLFFFIIFYRYFTHFLPFFVDCCCVFCVAVIHSFAKTHSLLPSICNFQDVNYIGRNQLCNFPYSLPYLYQLNEQYGSLHWGHS